MRGPEIDPCGTLQGIVYMYMQKQPLIPTLWVLLMRQSISQDKSTKSKHGILYLFFHQNNLSLSQFSSFYYKSCTFFMLMPQFLLWSSFQAPLQCVILFQIHYSHIMLICITFLGTPIFLVNLKRFPYIVSFISHTQTIFYIPYC